MTYEQRKRRRDLEIVAKLVQPNSRILDLGCGDGAFLKQLHDEKDVSGLGVEIDPYLIAQSINNGIDVIQRDLDATLDFAEDDSFDMVILSHTLQQLKRPDVVLREIVRVGRCAVVNTINFGYLPCRISLMLKGKMPVTSEIPYHWYDTPNIHLGTLLDFRRLCNKLGITIKEEIPVCSSFETSAKIFPNLFAPYGVFVLENRHKKKWRENK